MLGGYGVPTCFGERAVGRYEAHQHRCDKFRWVDGLLSGDGAGFVAGYRGEIANGVSPWWYVLRYWPAIFLASFVEESFFRGFV